MKPPTYLWDLLAALGVLLLAAGAGWVYTPLALIVPGAILLALALLGARRPPPRRSLEDNRADR